MDSNLFDHLDLASSQNIAVWSYNIKQWEKDW